MIENLYLPPYNINFFKGNKWWTSGEDPWQVLACCFEITDARRSKDPRIFISHFPVHQVRVVCCMVCMYHSVEWKCHAQMGLLIKANLHVLPFFYLCVNFC